VPDEAALRCRLLRSARLLLNWSQARLACEAGISTGTVHAVESGRLSAMSPAAQAIVQALERGGVQLLSSADQNGPGLRYAPGAALTQSRLPLVSAQPAAVSSPAPARPGTVA
jgi:transcriptional regulator with XRE-family HTH domain